MAAPATSSATIVSHQDAFRTVLDRKDLSLQVFRNYLRQQGDDLAHVDVDGNTVLHFLAIDGDANAFRELFQDGLPTSQMLKKGNFRGDTPLHQAASFGHRNVVEIIMGRDLELALARNNLGETPLYVAVAAGNKDVFDFVKQKLVGKDNILTRRNDGCTLLHAAVLGEYYSLALDIVESFPNLVEAHNEKGETALNLLASKPVSFRSGSAYSFINLGSRSFIPGQLIRCLSYLLFIPPLDKRTIPRADAENPPRSLNRFIPQLIASCLTDLKWKLISGYRRILRAVSILIRGVDDVKQKHALAVMLARRLIAGENDWSHYTHGESSTDPRKNQGETNDTALLHPMQLLTMHFSAVTASTKNNRMRNPLIQAVENSIEEFVAEILGRFPDAAYTVDKNGKNVLHIAVEQKDKLLYDYLKTKVRKDVMLTAIDNQGNTILHLATKQGNSPRILLGHMNQMAWDVCWFKRIWYDSSCHFQYHRNLEGKTPGELFQENHVILREKAEKALKDMNTGLMLVSTLIGTVNYATLFTVPGGYNDDDKDSKSFGRPKFFSTKKEDLLLSFLWYTGVSLFCSGIALATMLLIQLSRFTNDDFYMTLPLRYVGSLAALFVSAIFTVTACVQTYLLLEINVSPYYLMWPLIGFIILLSVDVVYLTLDYMYFCLCCAVSFTGQEM